MATTRRTILASALGFALSLTLADPVAARPSVSCTRLGQEAVVDGTLFRCVRRRGRLVWRRVGRVDPGSTPEPAAPAPTGWAEVMPLTALGVGRAVVRAVPGTSGPAPEVLLARGLAGGADSVRAFDARCTHRGCIVAVESDDVICRCHYSTFSPVDGSRLGGPAPSGLPEWDVDIRGGSVYVRLP